MNKITKITPWHADFIKTVGDNFDAIDAQFNDGVKKAVWLGLFLNYAKEQGKADRSIPHGEFGPFMKANLPNVNWRKAQRYMTQARNVAKAGKFEIRHVSYLTSGGKLQMDALVGNGAGLPPELLRLKNTVDFIVDDKNQNQLMLLDVKQVELGADGELKKKHGRLKGKGGASAAQRAKAKAAADAAEIEAMELWAEEAEENIRTNSDDAHWGKIADARAESLLEAFLLGADYLKALIKRRKAGKEGAK